MELHSLNVAPPSLPGSSLHPASVLLVLGAGPGPLPCQALLPVGCRVGTAEHLPFWRPGSAPTSGVCTAGHLCTAGWSVTRSPSPGLAGSLGRAPWAVVTRVAVPEEA